MEESREERLTWLKSLRDFEPFKKLQAEMKAEMDNLDAKIHDPKIDDAERGGLVAEWQARATIADHVDAEIDTVAGEIKQDEERNHG